MGAKTVYNMTVFTREEVARAYNAADGKIIGASLIQEVELKMELFNLSKIRRTDISESARECIEWGLINEAI
jgi:tryptophan synthase alpha subunit